MRNITKSIVIALIAILCSAEANADHLTAKFLFAARLDGAQEVPAVSTNALGFAYFQLNHSRDTLCFEMTATGLSGAITSIHIHEGVIGVGGPVVLSLAPYLSGNRIKGTITGSSLTSTFLSKMFEGKYYLNVHTAANNDGEIRGQILLEEDKGMVVMLNGANEVPAVMTNATGLGFFMLHQHNGRLSFNIVADGLSGPITGAHLHKAVAGQGGGVVQDLTSFISGNRVSGSVDPTPYLEALLSDSLYINLHTATNMNGEIRGQLVVQPNLLHFDAALDTTQETTSVTGTGLEIGSAALRLNYTFDTLWYDAQLNGLSGAITAAHFHLGGLNVGGGVIAGIPLTDINGNVISGMFTGATITDSFLRYLLEGNIYLNVHTLANINGEVRGQVYRTAREGYTFHINGAQESPMVNANGSGTGMVSIDRDQTNAHYMIAVDGLTNFTAAHFHNNVAGMNGGAIHTLTNMYNNGGVFGYWLNNDPNGPFTTVISNKFRKDSVYVNFHTTANINGEIRGNTSRKLCTVIPQSVGSLGDISVITRLYPNPTHNSATLDISSSAQTNTTILLYDVMGRLVWSTEKTLVYGNSRIQIPLDNLSAGMYSVQIRSNTGQISLKLTKQ